MVNEDPALASYEYRNLNRLFAKALMGKIKHG